MEIKMQSGTDPSFISFSRWEKALVGTSVDERGDKAVQFANDHSQNISTIAYNPSSNEIACDGDSGDCTEFEQFISGDISDGPVLLEATTLRTSEILIACRALKSLGVPISILYLEPEYYRRPGKDYVLNRRHFELSDEVYNFSAIPGFVVMLWGETDTRAVFLLGYEGQRLDQALEQLLINPEHTYVIFGVPAFQPGWEMNSFANNIKVIRERNISGDALFAGAQNPKAAFEAIEQIYSSCDNTNDERLIIFPIGTKPHGIGAALFACDHEGIGVSYDHPNLRQRRSRQVARWHLYDVTF